MEFLSSMSICHNQSRMLVNNPSTEITHGQHQKEKERSANEIFDFTGSGLDDTLDGSAL